MQQAAEFQQRIIGDHGDTGAERVGAERDGGIVRHAEIADTDDHALGKQGGNARSSCGHDSGGGRAGAAEGLGVESGNHAGCGALRRHGKERQRAVKLE